MRPAAAGWAIPAVTFLCLGARAQLANDASGQATGWYSIRLGTHFDQAGAEAQRREVESGGHTPVFIVEDPPAYRIQFGRFDSLVEARMYRQGLAEAGVSSGPEVVDLAVNDPGAPPDYRGEIPSEFRLGEFSFGPPAQLWHGEVRMEDLPPLGGLAGACVRLAVTPDGPASSVLSQGSGMARARVRDPSLRDLPTRALIELLPVARGEQPVEPAERLRACWNAAEMMRSAGRHEEAYRAFRDLRGALQDDDDLAVCDAEIVRVHLRITRGVMPFLVPNTAGAGLGTMQEARRVARRALAGIRSDTARQRQARAWIELAVMESLFYEGDVDGALAEACRIDAELRDDETLKPERCAALIRQGMCLMILQQDDAAKGVLLPAMALEIDPSIWIDDLQPDLSAAVCYATACERTNDLEGYRLAVAALESRHAEDPDTALLRSRLALMANGGATQ
ncbi:MAG: SPOR domain-containing protein [Candidatus Sumerlaeia bacterium]|nr:SPOR domain-containing protein [Candidatus Sumerlaeia bacterium]